MIESQRRDCPRPSDPPVAPDDLRAAVLSLARDAHRHLRRPDARPAGPRELDRRIGRLHGQLGPRADAPLGRWLASLRRLVRARPVA